MELWYRAELGALVRHLRAAGDIIAEGLRSSWPHVGDATSPRLPGLIAEAARKFGNIDGTARRLAGSLVRRSLVAVDERLAREVRGSVGIDITPVLTVHGPISAEMAAAAKANADLITSIPAQYLDEVRDSVAKAFESGLRWESIAERIKEIGDITDGRARLIARDQTSKLNSAFNRVRQTGLGITRYRWSGAMDQRERASHRALEGQVFAWASPPVVDGEASNPGEPINCRCVASPQFDLDAVELNDDPGLEAVAA